jgi:hypothetical protein
MIKPILWDLITGNAPINEYSLLGYQMLFLSYIMVIVGVPFFAVVGYQLVNLIYRNPKENQLCVDV